MTDRSFEVVDFTYLTISQMEGFLWDFKFKYLCKSTQTNAYHIVLLPGYNKNIVISRGQEQLFFTVSEAFLACGPSSNIALSEV